MAKQCKYCGKRKGWTEYNYAGFDVKKKGTHDYPERIKELVLPGNKKTDFICGDCANKEFTVECLEHGPINNIFMMGLPPTCTKCKNEKAGVELGEV